MLTPLDIQNKEFSKGVRGYKEEEVDEFLDQIITDFQTLLSENVKLRSDLEDANKKVQDIKSTEGSVITTLESAKALMNEIAQSAEKRAEVLVKNAELDAELKVRQAKENLAQLKSEETLLRTRVSSYKTRLKALLDSELTHLDTLEQDVFND